MADRLVRVGVRWKILKESRHGRVPQIGVATVLRPPALVEKQVHPPLRDDHYKWTVKVGMDVEEPTGRDLWETLTVERWIGDEVLHLDEVIHDSEKPRRTVLVRNIPERAWRTSWS